ncbi:MAG: hypothetical protein Q4E05_09615 [Pseudoclavibacter sp.]|nr:hypothetical protein [Pseudoclavibacter sp.]
MPSTRTLRRAATASALAAVCTGALSGCLFLPLVDGVTVPLKEREPRSSSPVPSEPEPSRPAPEQSPPPEQTPSGEDRREG